MWGVLLWMIRKPCGFIYYAAHCVCVGRRGEVLVGAVGGGISPSGKMCAGSALGWDTWDWALFWLYPFTKHALQSIQLHFPFLHMGCPSDVLQILSKCPCCCGSGCVVCGHHTCGYCRGFFLISSVVGSSLSYFLHWPKSKQLWKLEF